MTPPTFPDYQDIPSLDEKESFHAEMKVAERLGALSIEWDRRAGSDGAIKYIELHSFEALSELLGRRPTSGRLEEAKAALQQWEEHIPNLVRLLDAWQEMRSPRSVSVEALPEVVDACRLLKECAKQQYADVSVRRISSKLFGDSKRIERLSPALDLLTAPNFIEDEARHPQAVLASLGLLQHPQPVLVAGNITILSGRLNSPPVHSNPTFPYSGYAPNFMHGASGSPDYLLSVENLTTFNELASEMGGPLTGAVVYTGGFASPSMLRAYCRLVSTLPASLTVYHWGDTDLGGFRIARQLAEALQPIGRQLNLWMMGQYEEGPMHQVLSEREKALIRVICQEWAWDEVGTAVCSAGHAMEQEMQPLLLPPLIR
jgi:hypothetical protein